MMRKQRYVKGERQKPLSSVLVGYARRITSCILAIILCISLFPVPVFATEEGISDYEIAFNTTGVTSRYHEKIEEPLTLGSEGNTVTVSATYVLKFTTDSFTMTNNTGYAIN